MPHDRDDFGVGRGNGLGSRRTQFGREQPSNKGGRKKKERVSPSVSLSQAIQRLLSESERIKRGDRYVEMSRYDMLAHKVFENLEKTDFKERLALITALAKLPPAPPLEANSGQHAPTLIDVLNDMAAEAAADEALWQPEAL